MLAQVVTGNLTDHFLKVTTEQKKYPCFQKYDHVIISDSDAAFRLIENDSFFQRSKTIISQKLWTDNYFNLSIAKNIGFRYAEKMDYDWIFIYDSDVVVLKDFLFPPNGFSAIKWHYPRQDDRTPPKDKEKYTSSSMFLLRKDIYSKYRYCEEMYGHAVDDTDFLFNQLHRDGICHETDNYNCLHLYHPTRVFYGDEYTFERNRNIYCRRAKEFFGDNIPMDNWFNKSLKKDGYF